MAVTGVPPLTERGHFRCARCGRVFNRTQMYVFDGDEACTECWEKAGEPEHAKAAPLPPDPAQFFDCESCGRTYNLTAQDPETEWCKNCRAVSDDTIAGEMPPGLSKQEKADFERAREEKRAELETRIESVTLSHQTIPEEPEDEKPKDEKTEDEPSRSSDSPETIATEAENPATD